MRYNVSMDIFHLKDRLKITALPSPPISHGIRGFTLVEMAMVLAIIGLVMGPVLAMTKTLTASSRITSTQTKEYIIKTALINFIATNNRLPCPADPSNILVPASAGTEACSLTPNGTSPNKVLTGVVPWTALGLTQDSATDGYYNFFTYQVALTATQTVAVTAAALNKQTISGLKGAITILNSSGGTQINNCTTTGYNPCSAVAMIVSYGQDAYGAYESNGSQLPVPTGYTDENENANGDNVFVMKDASSSTTNPFDDILLPLTTNDLLSSLITNGSVLNYTAVLNNDFANLTSLITAYTILTRPNSSPSIYTLPSAITNFLPTVVPYFFYDPWGTPIKYTQTYSSGITCSNPIPGGQSAFTLSSAGPDGTWSTTDDISITIYGGQIMSNFQNAGC